MLNKDQKQEVGYGATAIQAGGDVHVGVTAQEARNIALDVAHRTFYELSGAAKESAKERVEHITNKVIEKLEQEYPAGLQKALDPGFQYALFTVQKEYARSGDQDLGDLLIDLLVEFSKKDYRDILQIVLNECLETVPKLTDAQLSSITNLFYFLNYQNKSIDSLEMLGQDFDNYVKPFVGRLGKTETHYKHLEFTGCVTRREHGLGLNTILGITYRGLFLKGIDLTELISRRISHHPRIFTNSIHERGKIQVNAMNAEQLYANLNDLKIQTDEKQRIVSLFNENGMNEEEIMNACVKIRPYMAKIFDVWADRNMGWYTLTSVGVAIGHTNIKRITGKFADLSTWIN